MPDPTAAFNLPFGPQPLGILPAPAGFLLLPESASPLAEEAYRRWIAGDLSGPMPEEWEFYRRAAEGDFDGALDALNAHDLHSGAVSEQATFALAYDRFVLSGDPEALAALPDPIAADLARLIACADFASGGSDELPEAPGAGESVHPLVSALVAMVRAAAQLGAGEIEAALATLGSGVEAARAISPSLAAQLLAQKASLLAPNDRRRAITLLREALSLVPEVADGGRSPLRAGLHLSLGELYHQEAGTDRSALLEAVSAYQAAIHTGLSLERGAEGYAHAQNNLGLAYLALPMGEAASPLRMAVAVQSFREALKVWTPEAHPEAWSSAQLNLANALQYLPSSHPEENLVQAVEIYEQLLAVRNRALDPLGYARLLANQANALAHLGIFAPALSKLEEAHKLFHWHGEPDLAASALEQVARINERLAARSGAEGANLDVVAAVGEGS